MKRNVVLGGKLHKLFDGHPTEFGGTPQRDLVLAVELQGQQPGRFRPDRLLVSNPAAKTNSVGISTLTFCMLSRLWRYLVLLNIRALAYNL
jgi:hypothetical protein